METYLCYLSLTYNNKSIIINLPLPCKNRLSEWTLVRHDHRVVFFHDFHFVLWQLLPIVIRLQGGATPGEPGLGWLYFFCSTFCLVLPGMMGNWQKYLSRWARWGNISNQSQPNPGSPGDSPPCSALRKKLQHVNVCTKTDAKEHFYTALHLLSRATMPSQCYQSPRGRVGDSEWWSHHCICARCSGHCPLLERIFCKQSSNEKGPYAISPTEERSRKSCAAIAYQPSTSAVPFHLTRNRFGCFKSGLVYMHTIILHLFLTCKRIYMLSFI